MNLGYSRKVSFNLYFGVCIVHVQTGPAEKQVLFQVQAEIMFVSYMWRKKVYIFFIKKRGVCAE